jgi:hypothetical protein
MIKHFKYEYLILNVNILLHITAFHITKKPVFKYVNTGKCRNISRLREVKVKKINKLMSV